MTETRRGASVVRRRRRCRACRHRWTTYESARSFAEMRAEVEAIAALAAEMSNRLEAIENSINREGSPPGRQREARRLIEAARLPGLPFLGDRRQHLRIPHASSLKLQAGGDR